MLLGTSNSKSKSGGTTAAERGIGKTRVSLKLLHLHKRFKDCGVNIMRKFTAEATPGRYYNCPRFSADRTRVLQIVAIYIKVSNVFATGVLADVYIYIQYIFSYLYM